MNVVINDQSHELAEEATIHDALQYLRVAEEGLAVAVNYTIVPKPDWASHHLVEGDVVMLVTATQGG